MNDFEDNNGQVTDTFSQIQDDTKRKAKGWWSSLPFPAQAGVGIGALLVGAMGIGLMFNAAKGAVSGNPYELTPSELVTVNQTASTFFQSKTQSLGNGQVLVGRLGSCLRTDSDKDLRFSCNGDVPTQVKVIDDTGKTVTSWQLAPSKINCDKPRGGVTGCSLK
jgi:hypothetical protein